jgi:hypothetical protein
MPTIAILPIVMCVAALMLIVAVRSLTWHKISPFLNGLLLLLVLFATWQVLARSGTVPLERGILLTLCGMVGLIAGVIHSQNAPMRFEPSEGDVICRRGAFLSFAWAVVVMLSITLLAISSLRAPIWAALLPPALVFLTSAFILSTFVLIARANVLRREHVFQAENEQPMP